MKADLNTFAGLLDFARAWLAFKEKYWDRLDDERRASYRMDYDDGIYPPKEESLSSIDTDEML